MNVDDEITILKRRVGNLLRDLTEVADARWQKEVWGHKDLRYSGSYMDTMSDIFDSDLGEETLLIDEDLSRVGISKKQQAALKLLIQSLSAFLHEHSYAQPGVVEAINKDITVLHTDNEWLKIVSEAKTLLAELSGLPLFPARISETYDV